MKTLRKISKSPFFALLLIFSFMNVSLGGNIHLNKSLESIEKAKTNNDEMIRSIIFADGIITSELPVLNDYVPNLSEEKSLELKNFENEFINYLKIHNSNVYNSFAKNMTSKDFDLISETYDNTYQEFKNFASNKLKEQYNTSFDEIVKEYSGNSNDLYFNKDGDTCLIAIAIVLTVAIAWHITKYKVEDVLAPEEPLYYTLNQKIKSSIFKETLISQIYLL